MTEVYEMLFEKHSMCLLIIPEGMPSKRKYQVIVTELIELDEDAYDCAVFYPQHRFSSQLEAARAAYQWATETNRIEGIEVTHEQ